MMMDELAGLVVLEVWVGDGEGSLFFKVAADEGFEWRRWDTEADCCSETWFADIYGVESLLGERVVRVETLDMPSPNDNRSRQEQDEAYGLALGTAKGKCTVVFRNSSNGYYGGCVRFIGDMVPGSKDRQILTDWSA